MQYTHLKEIGSGFYNIRGSFKLLLGLVDLGTHMSICKLPSGRFVIVDTIEMNNDIIAEINHLTDDGKLIEGVLATHPCILLFTQFTRCIFPHFTSCIPIQSTTARPAI
jgi:hypothetical protein